MPKRAAIDKIDAARLSKMVLDRRLQMAREIDGRPWSQEDLADALGQHLGLEVTRHHAAWLESSPTRPLGTPFHRDLWAGACEVLGLDRAKVNLLAGGV